MRFFPLSFLFLLTAGGSAEAAPQGVTVVQAPTVEDKKTDKKIDKLIDDQKYEEAAKALDEVRKTALNEGREHRYTGALIKQVQLRIALHGYETAVRFLRDEPWPKNVIDHTAVELYYAWSLFYYVSAHGWEIRQRERVDAKGVVDLKAWTQDQIVAEAIKAYDDVWRTRNELGDAPLADLNPYLSPNNYPKEIRGTLRDAISYLTVNLLANTSYWRPEESNSIYQLDFAALLKGGSAHPFDLKDDKLHPLQKICAVLDDLEEWHTQKGQAGAALEARLERWRKLAGSFTSDDEHAAVIAAVEERLGKSRCYPWWAIGQAFLAVSVSDFQHDFVRAHALAADGAKGNDLGAQRCLSIEKSIEQPSYSVAGMRTDLPGCRSLEVTHSNLRQMYFRAYPIDLVHRITTVRDYNLLPNWEEVQKILRRKTRSDLASGARGNARLQAAQDLHHAAAQQARVIFDRELGAL